MFRDRGSNQAVALAAEIGFAIACPLLAGIGGGLWADQQFNTRPLFVLLGIGVGLVLAFGTMYNLTRTPPGGRSKRAAAPAAPVAAPESTAPPLKLAGARPTGPLNSRLNNALDDLLARLEKVGEPGDLAEARQLRQALAPEEPDLGRLIRLQSYFAARPALVRDAADHFFSDPVVSEILDTLK